MEFSSGRSKMEKEWKKQACSSPTEMPLGDEGLEGKGGEGWRGTSWGKLHILRNISGRLGWRN